MTYSFDTNILLYATFSQYPEHKASRRLLDTMGLEHVEAV